jgi:nitroreductase
MGTDILKALQWRYAVKTFDASKKVTQEDLTTILESARLAPSSFGIEAWKFLVVESPELRAKLRAVAYDQTKVTDASHLIIVTRRTDAREHITQELVDRTAQAQGVKPEDLGALSQMVGGAISNRSDEQLDAWIKSQTYIALGMMIETAALLNIDSCPMEGFDASQVDVVLGLSAKNLATTSMLAIGYRGEDPAAQRAKVRRAADAVVEFIK